MSPKSPDQATIDPLGDWMGEAVPKEEQVKEEYLVGSKIPSQAVRGAGAGEVT